ERHQTNQNKPAAISTNASHLCEHSGRRTRRPVFLTAAKQLVGWIQESDHTGMVHLDGRNEAHRSGPQKRRYFDRKGQPDWETAARLLTGRGQRSALAGAAHPIVEHVNGCCQSRCLISALSVLVRLALSPATPCTNPSSGPV